MGTVVVESDRSVTDTVQGETAAQGLGLVRFPEGSSGSNSGKGSRSRAVVRKGRGGAVGKLSGAGWFLFGAGVSAVVSSVAVALASARGSGGRRG